MTLRGRMIQQNVGLLPGKVPQQIESATRNGSVIGK